MTFCSLVMIGVLSNAEAGRCAPRPLRARPRLTLQPNDTVCPIIHARALAGEQRRLGGVREDLEARLRPRHPAARRRDRAAASAGLDRGLQYRSPALRTAVPLTPRVPRLECLNPTSRLSGQTGCTPLRRVRTDASDPSGNHPVPNSK